MSMMSASAVSDAPPLQPARFIGGSREFWRIIVRGAVLLMITLGIYRFWLATDVRRYLWANTAIDGEALEYSGTAIELLRGFLIAVALLLPVYTIFLITILDLGPLDNILSVSAILLLLFLSQYGTYLARGYRLTRTVFRGLRFHQSGSAFRYAICALWWWGLTIVTLGFAYPFNRAALERFKMRNTYYGDLQGRFEASGWRLFIRGCLMWLAVLIPALLALLALGSIDWPAAAEAMQEDGDILSRLERASPGILSAIAFAISMLGTSFALIALLMPAFHALVVRWWLSGIRFGDIAVTSYLRTRDVYWAYLRFAAYVMGFALIILAGVLVALVAIGVLFGSARSQAGEIAIVLMMIGTYVVTALGLSTLYQGTVIVSVWRLAVDSAALSQTYPLAHVRAAGEATSPLGEGITDILNLGGI